MLISLIMQIAQSMQISIRHFLTPQTMHITFPLKNLAVKHISGLTHCRYSSGKWTILTTMFLNDWSERDRSDISQLCLVDLHC